MNIENKKKAVAEIVSLTKDALDALEVIDPANLTDVDVQSLTTDAVDFHVVTRALAYQFKPKR